MRTIIGIAVYVTLFLVWLHLLGSHDWTTWIYFFFFGAVAIGLLEAWNESRSHFDRWCDGDEP
jgi:multisubunit Na+/H+ antiporter MnhE subunit